MLNRHGLVAGATGTGKTKTLQLLAEQLSANGVPVFAADVKGDLSGLATPGEASEKLTARTASVGQEWTANGLPGRVLRDRRQGHRHPAAGHHVVVRPGPAVQGARPQRHPGVQPRPGLPLRRQGRAAAARPLRPARRRQPPHQRRGQARAQGARRPLVRHRRRDPARADHFSDQGADAFFGEPEFESADLLQVTADGKGLISLVELPDLADRPAVFSTFLMWLLADLFHDLPEVGDIDRPKLVFFFDEAHLLFNDASKDFLDQIAQTVRLIRSKGVGVFFVTQSPTDVPDEVLAQLGSRVQHALRAHTPNDAKALKATVNTYPNAAYDDLGEVITTLGIGEAIITVMGERGAPTPVAWTRLRAPESLMAPTAAEAMQATVARQPTARQVRRRRRPRLGPRDPGRQARGGRGQGRRGEGGRRAGEGRGRKDDQGVGQEAVDPSSRRTKEEEGVVTQVVKSGAFKQFMRTAAAEIARGLFGTGRR